MFQNLRVAVNVYNLTCILTEQIIAYFVYFAFLLILKTVNLHFLDIFLIVFAIWQ